MKRLANVEHRTFKGWQVRYRLEGEYSTEDLAKLNEACKAGWRVKPR